jgi:predicted pyridoxine 5'-phosphate oxidase superfamily flavin-nucleotide-binding protein
MATHIARFRNGSRRRLLADKAEEITVHHEISADERNFIEDCDMFFLATVDPLGRPTCSYKGGDKGFVRVLDGHTIAFPLYDGNGMYLSAGNMTANPFVGLLFIDFENPRRLRLQGTAAIASDEPLLATYFEAQMIVRVSVTEIFLNCPRYVHRHSKIEDSPFTPRPGIRTPIPDWKRRADLQDVLPRRDLENIQRDKTPS